MQQESSAKKIALFYNVLGVIIAVSFILLKQPVFLVMAIIYPLIGIGVMATSNGLIKFSSDSLSSTYPSIILGFLAPAITLFAKSFSLYRIYSFDNLWLPFIGLAIIITVALFKIGINRFVDQTPTAQLILMAGLSLFYAFGTVDHINCGYDKSPDHFYKAVVIGHHISSGKTSTHYYLHLSTWGPCHELKQIGVDESFFENTNVGDSLKIDLKPGLLHIPWFVVSK